MHMAARDQADLTLSTHNRSTHQQGLRDMQKAACPPLTCLLAYASCKYLSVHHPTARLCTWTDMLHMQTQSRQVPPAPAPRRTCASPNGATALTPKRKLLRKSLVTAKTTIRARLEGEPPLATGSMRSIHRATSMGTCSGCSGWRRICLRCAAL